MTTPITPATIAKLCELIVEYREAWRHWFVTGCSDTERSGIQATSFALSEYTNGVIPALLSQLAAQAAEIERWRSDWKRIAADEAVWYTLSDIFGVEGMTNAAGVVSGVTEKWNERQNRVADLERELALSAQRNAALLSDKDAVGAVLRTDSSLAELRGRAERLEGLLRKHSALACSTCMGTGAYLGDEDRDGPCDACGGTGAVLPEEVADVLAEREGGR